jgi:probable F420-dependent oxidoreductase
MKVRIGLGTGGARLDGAQLGQLADDLVALGFDSLWLSEVLTGSGVDPMIGLAWAGAHNPRLKLGTTMVLPGRNPVRLAGQTAVLDYLTMGRLLLTFVPGLAYGPERQAVGVAPVDRGAAIEEVLPLLRRLWSGETVSHDGPSGRFADVSISPLPVQQPFEVWLGGLARSSLERCGRLADGWLPSMCAPEAAAEGRKVVEESAAAAGRTISEEHFGVSVAYARTPLDDATVATLAARMRGRSVEHLVPVGLAALHELIERYVAVGFSKFVVRPLLAPTDWRRELDELAGAILDLQT